jgi:hypothetical protein
MRRGAGTQVVARAARPGRVGAQAAVWALAVGLTVAACAPRQTTPGLAPYSPTLGPFIYYEEGKEVLLTVGAFATRQRPADTFVPVEIGMANKDLDRTLILSRESFTLQVGDGEEIEMADAPSVIEGYRALEADRRLFRSREFTAAKFDRYRVVASSFYPNSPGRRGLVRDTVELPPGTYFQDVLYFKNPGFSLAGLSLRLLVRLRANEDPLVVAFKTE